MCPESFFKTLKREEVYLHDYRTFEEAAANLSRFIEDVCKRRASRSWTLRAGIRLMAVGRWYVSISHTDADIDWTIEKARGAWREARA